MKRIHVVIVWLLMLIISVICLWYQFDAIYVSYLSRDSRLMIKSELISIDDNADWHWDYGRGDAPIIVDDHLIGKTVYLYDYSGEKCNAFIVSKGIYKINGIEISNFNVTEDELNHLAYRSVYNKSEYLKILLSEYRELPTTVLQDKEGQFVATTNKLIAVLIIGIIFFIASFLNVQIKAKNVLLVVSVLPGIAFCVFILLTTFI